MNVGMSVSVGVHLCVCTSMYVEIDVFMCMFEHVGGVHLYV